MLKPELWFFVVGSLVKSTISVAAAKFPPLVKVPNSELGWRLFDGNCAWADAMISIDDFGEMKWIYMGLSENGGIFPMK